MGTELCEQLNIAIDLSNVLRQILQDKEEDGEIYAVLTGGSTGVENLFSVTNVCLMYHLLLKHGVKPENIITFANDTSVNDKHSPWPGELRTSGLDKDVYKGCRIDYRNENLNFDLFASVLVGNQTDEKFPVLKSTSKDRVLLYHSGHGGHHEFEFGNERVQTDRFRDALTELHSKGMYKQLFYHFESCYSGSMFVDWLTPNYNILAITAANPNECAYGCTNKDSMVMPSLHVVCHIKDSHVSKYGNFDLLIHTTDTFFGLLNQDEFTVSNQTCLIQVLLQEADLYRLEYQIKEAEEEGDAVTARRLNNELQKQIDLLEHTNQKIDSFVTKMCMKNNFRENTKAKVDLECYGEMSRTFHKHCHNVRQFLESKEDGGELYAVLTGGSSGLGNLFSETNVCLMYHILRKHGVKDENIITFAGDDNVNDTNSPWPGELRPQPIDPDVRQSCRIGYSYENLNFDLFAEALIGNDTGGIFEHYPVLKSTSKDRVLLYHSGHGDSHEFEFGYEWVQADRLQKALTAMHDKGMYKQLFYHFESCFSGSMFVDWLTPKYNILAYTAANPHQYAVAIGYKGWIISVKFSCHMQQFIEQNKDLSAFRR
ncbi:unnamed protein product [Bursaphelenchus okinawaensis]|uniref:Legumain n=1 Tax=Bursaphelenchus okinawaensis TaxID=465554 RepID=A0A811LT44_9BILA|nr:unnamed protein product [Bursaphelenchus okinawaensis]CAG9128077.1 unnamed protein product [Bursaphelenchus okinawaensis]